MWRIGTGGPLAANPNRDPQHVPGVEIVVVAAEGKSILESHPAIELAIEGKVAG